MASLPDQLRPIVSLRLALEMFADGLLVPIHHQQQCTSTVQLRDAIFLFRERLGWCIDILRARSNESSPCESQEEMLKAFLQLAASHGALGQALLATLSQFLGSE